MLPMKTIERLKVIGLFFAALLWPSMAGLNLIRGVEWSLGIPFETISLNGGPAPPRVSFLCMFFNGCFWCLLWTVLFRATVTLASRNKDHVTVHLLVMLGALCVVICACPKTWQSFDSLLALSPATGFTLAGMPIVVGILSLVKLRRTLSP